MLKKESEARGSEVGGMVCPAFQVAKINGVYVPPLCHGSDCMAWRWFSEHEGYCGLAGKPLQVECAQLLGVLPDVMKMARGGSC